MKAQPIEVKVEPTVLVWARTTIGLTDEEAAARSGIDVSVIRDLEGGKRMPDMSMLGKLASVYKRPTAVFFLPEPPAERALPEDFRTLPDEKALPITERTRLVIRRARRLQSIALELREGKPVDLVRHLGQHALSDDPEVVAKDVRSALRVSAEEQEMWGDEVYALDGWRKALERIGILVLQLPMIVEEARALSLADGGIPLIVINSRDSINARIFSLMHELGHLVLQSGGVCIPTRAAAWEPKGQRSRDDVRRVEMFCNHLAGAVLVPRDLLLRQPLAKHTETAREWSDRELNELVKVFHVSKEVMLRRLLILGQTTTEYYRRKHEQWSVKGERVTRRGGGKGRDRPLECISQNGTPFVSLVLDSYRNDRITYNDVADFLDVKVKHIPKIERMLEAR